MSTSYYSLKKPFGAMHPGPNSKTLILRDRELNLIGELEFTSRADASEFIEYIIADEPAVTRHGVGGGQITYVQHQAIDSMTLVNSEYQCIKASVLALAMAKDAWEQPYTVWVAYQMAYNYVGVAEWKTPWT